MALDQTVQVDLPKHGIAYKKISGKTYVYYVTAAYRLSLIHISFISA